MTLKERWRKERYRFKNSLKALRLGRTKEAAKTERHVAASLKNLDVAHRLPKTKRQMEAIRKNLSGIHSAKPNGYCDICGVYCYRRRDHRHPTGRRRGGLCHSCNTGLGLFKDSPWLLKEAAKYLEKYIKRFPRLPRSR